MSQQNSLTRLSDKLHIDAVYVITSETDLYWINVNEEPWHEQEVGDDAAVLMMSLA